MLAVAAADKVMPAVGPTERIAPLQRESAPRPRRRRPCTSATGDMSRLATGGTGAADSSLGRGSAMPRSTDPRRASDGRAIVPEVRGKVGPMSSPANIESMPGDTDHYIIGLISDTHGLFRPGVHSALDGVELIL